MRVRFRLLPIVWLMALLLVPLAGWLLGARQPLLDNRPKTPFPHLSADALGDAATYKQIDAALFERLPPRQRAVKAHTQIALNVFSDSPNPDVAIGSDGYLYYVPTLQTCTTRPPVADPADAIDVLGRTFLAAGKKALVLEPAAKLFIHPQDAPSINAKAEKCARQLQERVARRVAESPAGFDIDTPLKRMEAAGQPTFLRHDTHWNWRGRLLFAKTVLDFLRPGLSKAVGLHAGDAFRRPGDEAAMLGLDTTDSDRPVLARRAPKRPIAPGRAVLIGDSQLQRTFLTAPGAAGTTPLLDTVAPGTPTCDLPTMVAGGCDAAIAGASHVVYESVGRNLTDVDATCWRPVLLLAEGLTGAAGRYKRVDGAAPVDGRTVTIGAGGSAKLRVVAPGGDVSGTPRLLKLGLRDLPAGATAAVVQEPRAGTPAPCATPQQTAATGSLIVPVPAGRRASDLVVTVTAPTGTRLIAPREIALDGRPAKVVAGR
jgi:hypothetical protein